LKQIKESLTYQEALKVLLEIIREENDPELQKIIRHKSDFENPDKMIEMFASQNGLAGRDKDSFHDVLKVIHLKELLLLDVPRKDPKQAEAHCQDILKSVFERNK
jgi:hypothetical protein